MHHASAGGSLPFLRQTGTVRDRARLGLRSAQRRDGRSCRGRVRSGLSGLRRGLGGSLLCRRERRRRGVPGRGGAGADEGEQAGLCRGDALGQLAVPLRLPGLPAQAVELGVHLLAAVPRAQQVGLSGA